MAAVMGVQDMAVKVRHRSDKNAKTPLSGERHGSRVVV
jgi:hypothetical protein